MVNNGGHHGVTYLMPSIFFFVVPSSRFKTTSVEKYLIIQTRENLSPFFMRIKFIKTSHLVLWSVFNFREAQAGEGLLVTVEQRACEEIR